MPIRNKNIIIKPGSTKDLLLKLDSGKDPGFIEGTVLIKTDLPNLPEKIIILIVEVENGLKIARSSYRM